MPSDSQSSLLVVGPAYLPAISRDGYDLVRLRQKVYVLSGMQNNRKARLDGDCPLAVSHVEGVTLTTPSTVRFT